MFDEIIRRDFNIKQGSVDNMTCILIEFKEWNKYIENKYKYII